MRFSYTVISTDGKKLNGTIDSPNEESARKDLNSLGFSIITLSGIDESAGAHDANHIIFEFEGYDKKNKKVTGTIPARDKFAAFKRLKLEYKFTVLNICKGAASPYEKLQEKQEGVLKLEQQLEEEQLTQQQSKESPEGEESHEEIKQSEEQLQLKHQTDLVLQKTAEILAKYNQELSVEEKQNIDAQLNKLLRIKNSGNIEYVRDTAKELLQSLQTLETLLVNRNNDFNKSKIKFDVLQLMSQLKKPRNPLSLLERSLKSLQDYIENTPITQASPLMTKTRVKAAKFFVSNFLESPEMRALKHERKLIWGQIFDYIKMYFKEESAIVKLQIRNSISGLLNKRKTLKIQLKELKKLEKERLMADVPENFLSTFTEELFTFSGWLLSFYLVYYFLSLYVGSKDFGLDINLQYLSLYNSHFFKYLLVMLFLTHCAISLKVLFFKKNRGANFILAPAVLLSIMLIMFNL